MTNAGKRVDTLVRMAKTPNTVKSSPPVSRDRAVGSAILLIAVVIAGAALHWLGAILTPLALAIFLMVMIEGFSGFLGRRLPKLPAWAAMSFTLVVSVALLLAATWIIVANAARFISQIESYYPRIDAIISQVYAMIGASGAPTVASLVRGIEPKAYVSTTTQGLQDAGAIAVTMATVFVYMGFLIASRAGFRRKWVRLFPSHDERTNALEVFGRIKIGVERYLWVQTVTGLMIAAGSWAAMASLGLDNAFFWAFLIFLVSYIPIIGPMIGCLAPPLFALVQFDGYKQAIVLLIALNAINFVVANFVLPRMQAQTLNLDPVVVLLSLAFWGVIWGVPGMFLSTPLTVAAMVILAQFKTSHWVAILLSGNGDPLGELKTVTVSDEE